MAKASTYRLRPEIQAGLETLSKVLRRPKNKLMNEAVHLYVQQRSRELEQEMEVTLKTLRDYRQKDPEFEKAIDTLVAAEVNHASEDPVEGQILPPAGTVQSEIRNLLHA